MSLNSEMEMIILCPRCKKVICSGELMKTRIIYRNGKIAKAKCSCCKTWVKVPFINQKE